MFELLFKHGRPLIKLILLLRNFVAFFIKSSDFRKEMLHTLATRFGIARGGRCFGFVNEIGREIADSRAANRGRALLVFILDGLVSSRWRDRSIENIFI